jgi:ribonuclease HI
MNLLTLNMTLTDESNGYFIHRVDHDGQRAYFRYHPGKKDLIISPDGSVAELLLRNRSQLMKVLSTRRIKTFNEGFQLRFVLTDNKNVRHFHDMSKIIVLDRRTEPNEILVCKDGKQDIHELYTDASFIEETGHSGIAAILKYPDGSYKLHSIGGKANNNCRAELDAVLAGFELLSEIDEIRLITDSRYVRKGLTEWMFNWMLNGWLTSNGTPAKNLESWMALEKLTRGKYVEVAWVKGHSGHFENTMCDLYARDAAEKE